jgi:hypothetical protein
MTSPPLGHEKKGSNKSLHKIALAVVKDKLAPDIVVRDRSLKQVTEELLSEWIRYGLNRVERRQISSDGNSRRPEIPLRVVPRA